MANEHEIAVTLADGFYADEYQDRLYGSMLPFRKGESQLVPATLAAKLLQHPDVYVKGDAAQATPAQPVPEKQPDKDKDEDDQAVLDSIGRMTIAELVSYADKNFKAKLNPKLGSERLKAEVSALINKFGAP